LFVQIKKLLKTRLDGIEFKKLKVAPFTAYFSLTSLEDLQKALELFDNYEFRGRPLTIKRTANEPDRQQVNITSVKIFQLFIEETDRRISHKDGC
jgi:hypothetical protein